MIRKSISIIACQNTTSSLTRELRESIAYEAARPLSLLNIAAGQPGMYEIFDRISPSERDKGLPWLQDVTGIYAALALQDYYTSNSTWKDFETVNFPAAIRGKSGFFAATGPQLYSDVVYWGLAFFYAYRTYRQPDLLDIAEYAWNILYTGAFITPADAASGSSPARNVSFSLSPNCTGGKAAPSSLLTLEANQTCRDVCWRSLLGKSRHFSSRYPPDNRLYDTFRDKIC